MSLTAGTRLGPYEILAPIGAGGMGEVYRAHDTKLKRDVALKVLPEAFARDSERLARFEREAEVLASLNHPNIASIYGVVEDRALVMELVEGTEPKGPLPFDDAWHIASQMAAALEYAHDKGIVHRDLKPANIKVTSDGVVKLLDFGLAKAFTHPREGTADPENSPTLTIVATEVGMILGTAAYMSPEQARGKEVDKRADIWAFGVVLYEMLTGHRLFEGATSSDVLAQVLTKEPDLERIPVQIRMLLTRCLEKDPKRRLRDIGDCGLFLSAISGTKGSTPHRGLWPFLAAVFLLSSVALAWMHFRGTPTAQPLSRFRVDLGPNAIVGPRITAVISPDGRRLAFVARGPNGRERLAMRLLDQPNATLLEGTENATDPFFSPNSQWIGFFAEGKMKKISVLGGAALTLCDAPSARGASWGEDGTIIVTLNSTSGTGLSRVPDSGGSPQVLTKPRDRGETSHRWPQILPEGESVLFTASTIVGDYDNGSIQILSLKTGEVKVVERGGYFGRVIPLAGASAELVYIRRGTLLGVPFDLDRTEARGSPVPLLEDVAADATTAGGQFDFAHNGVFIYLAGKSSAASWPLVWLDSAGKMEPLLATPGTYYTPRLSPDGKRVAFFSNGGEIEIYDKERDQTTKLTFADFSVMPIWSHDGQHILYRSQSPRGFSLRWNRYDRAGEAQTLLETKAELRPYSLSVDDKYLAFAQHSPQNGFDIWTLPLDLSDPEHPRAGKPQLFLGTMFDEYEPAFSPDGRWIAYRNTESGFGEIFVQSFSRPGGKWLIGSGKHPVWSRNGKELFYMGLDNRIMVTNYAATGESFENEKPRAWSNAEIPEPINAFWNFDLSPDGKRILVAPRSDQTNGEKESVHVTVLLNFFDELRRKVPLNK